MDKEIRKLTLPLPTFTIYDLTGHEIVTTEGRWLGDTNAAYDFPELDVIKQALPPGLYRYRIIASLSTDRPFITEGNIEILPKSLT